MSDDKKMAETIVLAGGCFWCLEGTFAALRGVQAVECGYSNGQPPPITYEQVCTGQTGCVEVLRLQYDPAQISTAQLLQVFFALHDPTTLNRQGADVGTQYRSGIYTTTAEQIQAAHAAIATLAHERGISAVTEVQPLQHYQAAEDYHQGYAQRHPDQPYCRLVALPKLDKAKAQFSAWMRPS
jgi:peptide-methionine (S)-S-oxide reductase